MELDRKQILWINVVLCFIGTIISVVSANLSQSWVRILFESIGVGLLATGLVNFFDKFFTEAKKPVQIDIVSWQRTKPDRSVYAAKYDAKKVDLMGVSLANILNEFIHDQKQEMIDSILKHNARLRLLFVHPNSSYLDQRAKEDRISRDELLNRQLNSIEMAVIFYKYLLDAYKKENKKKLLDIRNMGSVEIYLTRNCPYISMYRVDNKIYWGLYTANKTGEEAPLFISEKLDKDGMFEILKEHYYGLLPRKDADNQYLVKMIIKDHEPMLNRTLVDQLLGAKRVDELLK